MENTLHMVHWTISWSCKFKKLPNFVPCPSWWRYWVIYYDHVKDSLHYRIKGFCWWNSSSPCECKGVCLLMTLEWYLDQVPLVVLEGGGAITWSRGGTMEGFVGKLAYNVNVVICFWNRDFFIENAENGTYCSLKVRKWLGGVDYTNLPHGCSRRVWTLFSFRGWCLSSGGVVESG